MILYLHIFVFVVKLLLNKFFYLFFRKSVLKVLSRYLVSDTFGTDMFSFRYIGWIHVVTWLDTFCIWYILNPIHFLSVTFCIVNIFIVYILYRIPTFCVGYFMRRICFITAPITTSVSNNNQRLQFKKKYTRRFWLDKILYRIKY